MKQIDETIFTTLKERMGHKFPILLSGYLRDAQKYLVTIETNLPNGDLDQIVHASHSLKSSSALLGIEQVSKTSEKIEYEAKTMADNNQSDFTQLSSSYSDLQNAFSHVQTELDERRQSIQAQYG